MKHIVKTEDIREVRSVKVIYSATIPRGDGFVKIGGEIPITLPCFKDERSEIEEIENALELGFDTLSSQVDKKLKKLFMKEI